MSYDQLIGAPFTLASLPKPVRSSNGRIHAAGVCSISGIKKRKRTEIAVGLNGEGVSIYSLQNPQLVTSHALPPSATFTTAPYSIFRKGSSKIPTQRFTYASLAGLTSADKPQLVCFREKTLGDSTETFKTVYTPSSPSQISTLESLPVTSGGATKNATHDVLATFDNGDVICLSADLLLIRWVANLAPLLSSRGLEFEIEHVSLTSARAATRGLLRSREDIVAILDPTPDDTSNLLELTQILCVLGRLSDGTKQLSLLQIQPRSPDLPTNALSPLKRLLSWTLPVPPTASALLGVSTQFALHASSGALHVLTPGTLFSYDFTGTVPRMTSELELPGLSVDSFLRTSQDVLFTTSRGTCRVFDVKYNSLQAAVPFGPATSAVEPVSPSKKRKHLQQDSDDQAASSNLIAYYADIGLVVAAREDEIFGMQFGGIATRKRVKTEGTLLIDALGRGIASKTTIDLGRDAQKWQDRMNKLSKYAGKGKIGKFEEAFAADLGFHIESSELAKKHQNEVEGGPLTNGGGPSLPDEDAMVIDDLNEEPDENDLRKWTIPESVPDNLRPKHRQYALYALRKIFRIADIDESHQQPRGSLKVALFPPNVFQWLLQTGHLTKESIRKSLLEEKTSLPNLVDGDIVNALVDYDPDLHILAAVLNHSQFLPVGEVVQAIKLLIQSIDDEPRRDESNKLLTNGAASSEDNMDLDFASEFDAASHEIDHALSILDHGFLTRSQTLRPALIRLHTFPGPMISSHLRSMLPRHDLESLIRLLHLEFRNGGWTSQLSFVDTDASSANISSEDPDDHAVAIIASLLSSALDAIGAGAWLASVGKLSASETSEGMIRSLQHDTSIAVSGFYEATFIRGLLSEFLRYATSIPKSQKPSNKKLEGQGKPFGVLGKLAGDEELPMLPLGGKADAGVEKMKSGKGGKKEERSKREMGMLISKKVPKYSFERIVI